MIITDELFKLEFNSFKKAVRLFYKGPKDNRLMIYFIGNYLNGLYVLRNGPTLKVIQEKVDNGKYLPKDQSKKTRDYGGNICPNCTETMIKDCSKKDPDFYLGCETYRQYCITQVIAALKSPTGIENLEAFFNTKCEPNLTLKDLLAQLYGFSITCNLIPIQRINMVKIFFEINCILASEGMFYDNSRTWVEVFKGLLYYSANPGFD